VAAKHTAPQDASLRASLARNLGGGAALILLVAVAFYGIGQVGRDAGTPVAADLAEDAEDPEERAAAPEPEEPEPEEPEGADPAEEPEEEPSEDEADDEPEAAEEPDEDVEPDEEDGDEGDETGDAEEAEDSAPAAFEPSEIVLQVLDGVGTDGGSAASRMAQQLRDGGYDVIAQNPAIAYQTTTVLWTSGNEAKARQVAAAIGAGDVRPQPGNLSESVDVHVVVGADRA
jgi:outer membrane biosynthesis protein TonB